MKGILLRYMFMAVIATVVIPVYGDGKVDYAQMEMLVTNRLVSIRHSEMVPYYRDYIKQRAHVTDSDIADCLSRYIRTHVHVMPCTVDYDNYTRALGQFVKLADDRQMEVLSEVAEKYSGRAACDALYHYYRRMRTKGGIAFVERLLDKESLNTNMYNEISMVLRMDAAASFGRDVGHNAALTAFARRQLERRMHLKLADTVMLRLNSDYANSELRRLLVEEVIANRISGLSEGQKEHFRAIKKSQDQRGGNKK